jgi:hypothetical protein
VEGTFFSKALNHGRFKHIIIAVVAGFDVHNVMIKGIWIKMLLLLLYYTFLMLGSECGKNE